VGNRCVITTDENLGQKSIGLYMHWEGNPEAVEAFLWYCNLADYRPPEFDNSGWGGLAQVYGNYAASSAAGISTLDDLDLQGDNGVYIIKDWKIVQHVKVGFVGNTWEEILSNWEDIKVSKFSENLDYADQDLYELVEAIHDAQPLSVQKHVIENIKRTVTNWPTESNAQTTKGQWQKFLGVLTKTDE